MTPLLALRNNEYDVEDEYSHLGDINKFLICTRKRSCRCPCCYFFRGRRDMCILKVF